MPIFHKNDLTFIQPNWPAPAHIKSCVTTRLGGQSQVPYEAFNLAMHVGDDTQTVFQNRGMLQQALSLPSTPFWLAQEHTDKAIYWEGQSYESPPVADASWATDSELVCCVLTADCLPLLVTNEQGAFVAAIHAGWKGLADGIVSNTIQALPGQRKEMLVWVGPAISQPYFEVGKDVLDAFVKDCAEAAAFFKPHASMSQKWYADLPGLAEFKLNQLGIEQVFQSGLCSYRDQEWFYSYRRDQQTGRMASLIWIETP
ncbi:peptidoglycan editing factor PgeF [Hydrogenovibrio sp. 3SP14C1]|uniref:peptidoglycan editing factor PgeF n=1 Tax=Hydrogenovibrio sp. 3SP14C1 TaxID=3038774 RepID=UPI002416E843|nr:peptidoglycan editing factor PgeF [Hydrogenovibrio sp. 3SP14C1]MDG4813009.1 peptidoglycan editing factor PgeF [Hydrogenovibrio sp. 3SP14C1]